MKLFLINIMYWIYLYSDSFIWQNNKEFLIYNTSSHNSIQGKCIGNLKTIILGLHNTINLYCIEWRKRSIPTHSEWLYPLTFDAGKGLKEA